MVCFSGKILQALMFFSHVWFMAKGILMLNLRKFTGALFVFSALAGMLLSILGLVGVWRSASGLERALVENLVLLDETLTATNEGLTLLDSTLYTTATDIASLQSMVDSVAKAIRDTEPVFETLTALTAQDLPSSIKAAQTALVSAQASAKLIDNVLGALTSVPFLPVSQYKPDVPLNIALQDVSRSLDNLPPSLSTIEAGLRDGRTSLREVNVELGKISATIQSISGDLDELRSVVARYQVVIVTLQARIDGAQKNAPGWVASGAGLVGLVLGWVFFSQLAVLLHGAQMLDIRRD
jgi:prefoldin subunit 5